MNMRLIFLAALSLSTAGCATMQPDAPKQCASNRVEEARPDMMVCSAPHNLRREPLLERRQQI